MNNPGVLCSRPSVTNDTWRRSIHSQAFEKPLIISDEAELELLQHITAVLFCSRLEAAVRPLRQCSLTIHTLDFFNSALPPPSSLINSNRR